MKKLLLLALFLLFALIGISQQTYVANKTELYEWNQTEWVYNSGNTNVKIPIYMLKRFIHIEANKHAYFYLNEMPETISGDGFSGFRYQAYDFSLETMCYIDIISSKSAGRVISIVWINHGLNLRYYLKNNNE
jgi:hypothetical protein